MIYSARPSMVPSPAFRRLVPALRQIGRVSPGISRIGNKKKRARLSIALNALKRKESRYIYRGSLPAIPENQLSREEERKNHESLDSTKNNCAICRCPDLPCTFAS